MVRLALGVFLLFGLVWLAASFGPWVLGMLQLAVPAGSMTAVNTGAGFVAGLAGQAMGLSAAAILAFTVARQGIPGSAGWGWLCLLAIPVFAAFAVLQFDPRLTATAQEAMGPAYNKLRAGLPLIRLALFLGVCLIVAAKSLSSFGGRIVTAIVLTSWVAMLLIAAPSAVGLLALPALAMLAVTALQLSEADRPGAPYILIGTVCLLGGLALGATNATLRAELRPIFALFPLLAGAAIHWRPRLPTGLLSAQALILAFCLAYLSPALNQFGDVRPALTFAEIGASVARASALRTGIGAIAALSAVVVLAAMWRRRAGRTRTDDQTTDARAGSAA
ncbi:MAG: hypothetical protein P8N72_09035 [Flavimaricola sp.]|nr:hypothetical protein [Flavimaricola sp.]